MSFTYNPGVTYNGAPYLAEGIREGKKNLAQFILGMAMPEGSGADKSIQPTFGLRLKAGALSAAEGFDKFNEQKEQFQQLADAGKAADFAVKANPDMLSELGMHPDQWKTLGAREKAQAVSGYTKAQGVKEVATRLQQMVQGLAADQGFASYMGGTGNRNAMRSFGEGNGPVAPGAGPLRTLALGGGYAPAGRMPLQPEARVDLNTWQDAAARFPNAEAAKPIIRQLAERMGSDFSFDPKKMVTPLDNDRMFVQTSKGGGQVVQTPESMAAELLATKPKADDIPAGYMAIQRGKGWAIVPDETQFESQRDPFSGVTTRRYIGKGAGAPNAGSKYKSAEDVRAAVTAGTLKKDEALKILREQFDYK